jgi:hypothetical protein
MTGHKNCLQADYLLGPDPSLIKKRIYRAAVSQRLRNTDIDHEVSRGWIDCYIEWLKKYNILESAHFWDVESERLQLRHVVDRKSG